MDTNAGTNRGFGRGAIIEQMQKLAASRLMNPHNGTGSSVSNTSGPTNGQVRGSGRGQLLYLLSKEQQSLKPTSLGQPALSGGAGRAKLRDLLSTILLTSSGEESASSDAKSTVSTLSTEELISDERSSASDNSSSYVPKTGTKGTPVTVTTNYIRLKMEPGTGVYEYHVKFEPNIEVRNLRTRLLNQHKSIIGRTTTFDGTTLYIPFRLKDQRTYLTSVLKVEDTQEPIPYNLELIFRRKQPMHECIHLYNIIFGRIMKELNMVRFGRKNFDPTAPTIIPQHKLEVWPGYVTAVDEYDDGVMLCLDVSHRVLCQTTVLELMTNAYNSSATTFKHNVSTALLGTVVLTRYNNKTYRIDDIDFDRSPADTFECRGQNVSFVEYYKTSYDLDIRDKRQPLLVHTSERSVIGQAEKERETVYLVPELCYLTGLSDTMRSDFKVMRDIASITRVTPNQRVLAMRTFCENVSNSEAASAILSAWGLVIDTQPFKITARQLGEETISFANHQVLAGPDGSFDRHATSNEVLEAVDLRQWILLHTRPDTKYAKAFIDCIERNARPMGIRVSPPLDKVLDSDTTELYVRTLRSAITSSTQIVVVICPTSRDDRYAAIKKLCCAEMPVPTQVINSRTLSNESKNRAIVQKIALQMNCKMGGTLWSVNIPIKKVMLCGMDTYHDTTRKADSVAAFVSSINGTFTKWFSQAVVQRCKEELGNGLCFAMKASLIAYREENGHLPERVIVYRDGVGNGQLKMSREYEIPQLQQAFEEMDEKYKPPLTFIVVQKRINTRIFVMNGKGDMSNPQPGCVLDHTITRRHLFDFFLVPQSVRQGTVTPTHYIVLYDEANFEPDILQRLTYKLCFLYYNWPGSIRVPACCQYAHKLAYLVGESVRRPTSEKLAKKLFYL